MQTLGVTEQCISIRQGGSDYIWRMYDVAGAVRLDITFLETVSNWNCLYQARAGQLS